MDSNQLFHIETIIVLLLYVHYKSLCQTTFPTILNVAVLYIVSCHYRDHIRQHVSQRSPSTVYKRRDQG